MGTPLITETKVIDFTDHIHYIPGYTNIGLLTTDSGDAYFIDTGVNELVALPAYEAFKKRFPNHNLKAVLVTHAHADHVGGNQSIFEKTGCEFWASRFDGFMLEMPNMMPTIITGGFKVKEMENDYYTAKSKNPSDRELKDGEILTIGNLKIEIFSIPGHFLSQIGFLVTEEEEEDKSIFFAGDGIYGRSEVKKYWIPYNFCETQFLESLEKIRKIRADITVPSHGNIIEKEIIDENAELNSLQMLETEQLILEILKEPKTFEQVLKEVADKNSLHLKVNQAYLIGSTIKSFLSCLQHKGLVKEEIVDNYIIWSRV